MRDLAKRADALKQVYPLAAEDEAVVSVTILVTSLAMNYVHRGAYFPEPTSGPSPPPGPSPGASAGLRLQAQARASAAERNFLRLRCALAVFPPLDRELRCCAFARCFQRSIAQLGEAVDQAG